MEDNKKAHSDDGSYEFVDSEELDYHKNDPEEDPYAEPKLQANITPSSDLETDLAWELFQDNGNDQSEDGSYEFVDTEEVYNCMTDSVEDPSAERILQRIGTESSDIGTDDGLDMESKDGLDIKTGDGTEMYEEFQFRTVAHQKADDHLFDFPANIKRKEHMEIKDIVKDHVLPFLPAKSLVRSRIVSKEWDQWIGNPFLAHKQGYLFREISGFFKDYDGLYDEPTFITLDRKAYGVPSPSLNFLPEGVFIRSSCNGLLLCQARSGESLYYICNPANQEWKRLPPPAYFHGDVPKIVLAFEPSTLNFEESYHVICAFTRPDEGPIIRFEIYNSMTMSWEVSEVDCIELCDSKLKDNGFYVNGVAYWETSAGELLAFDLKNEICGIHRLPCEGNGHGIASHMDGELCYIQVHLEPGNLCVVKIYGGILMSLKHSKTIDLPLLGSTSITEAAEGVFRVLPCVSGDVVAILADGYVYAFHLRVQKVKVAAAAENNYGARYLPYVNSLVSVVGQ